MTTVAELLEQTACLQVVSESWRLDGELLLANALGSRRETLHAHPEAAVPEAAMGSYNNYLQRRLRGEPLAYILGQKAFWDFELQVTNAVLIPRPETELLVEAVLDKLQARRQSPLRMVDLGTGSGAIAIALARSCPRWSIGAVERSSAALAVACANGEQLAAGRIDFQEGDWSRELPDASVDVLVSNPPYVAEHDSHLLADGLPFEPALALTAGVTGLDALRAIVGDAPRVLTPGGWLFLEHGFEQGTAVRGLLEQQGFTGITTLSDYSGQPRVSLGQL